MSVYAAIERRELAAQYLASQRLAVNDLTGGAQQHLKQIELDGCEIQHLAAPPDHAGARIHLDISNRDGRRRSARAMGGRRSPPQNSPDARSQFRWSEGLSEIIVVADFHHQPRINHH